MDQKLRNPIIASLVVLALVLGVGVGIALDRALLWSGGAVRASSSDPKINYSLIGQAWGIINRVYVDRAAVRSRPLTYGAIAGMVDALGDTGHSTFLSPEMVQDERSLTEGEYVGVGLEIQMQNNQVTIVAPLDGSPALTAGLRAGELILRVDGKDVTGLTLQQVVRRIIGPMGTKVTLTIFSPVTHKTFDATLVRARIKIQNVTWQPIPGTNLADLRIAAFSQGITKDLHTDLVAIEKEGFAGIVLDLRNDPGGILDEAIGTASQFLAHGNVLLERNAHGTIRPIPVQGGAIAPSIPLVVMIDGGTASASEIVAGALQDAGRAKLVGDKTFGTGTVLGIFPLSDGSELLLATEEWLTPRGRVIWHKGITPDVTVQLPYDAMLVEPASLNGMTAAELEKSGDRQLLEAIDILQAQTRDARAVPASQQGAPAL